MKNAPVVAAQAALSETELAELYPVLYRWARRLAKNESDADDLVQDTAVKALKYRAGFRGDCSARTWLYYVMRSVWIATSKKGKRNPVHTLGLDLPDIFVPDHSHAMCVRSELRSTVSKMEPGMRYALRLHSCGVKDASVALTLNIPIGTVKSRIHRGRKLIEEAIL